MVACTSGVSQGDGMIVCFSRGCHVPKRSRLHPFSAARYFGREDSMERPGTAARVKETLQKKIKWRAPR